MEKDAIMCGNPMAGLFGSDDLEDDDGSDDGAAGMAEPAAPKVPDGVEMNEEDLSFTFKESGTLGIVFSMGSQLSKVMQLMVTNGEADPVVVLSIQEGTIADGLSPHYLRVGMVLERVQEYTTKGLGFADVMGLIKSAGRPLTLQFEHFSEAEGGGARIVHMDNILYNIADPKKKKKELRCALGDMSIRVSEKVSRGLSL